MEPTRTNDPVGLEAYLRERFNDCVESAAWNLNRGLVTEAYGWECRMAEIAAIAHDQRLGEVEKDATKLLHQMRDKRESKQFAKGVSV